LIDKYEYQTAVRKYIKDIDWVEPLAVTLTHKKSTMIGAHWVRGTSYCYSQNLRHLRNVLNKKIYKRGFYKGNGITCIAALEPDGDNRLHYHALLDARKDKAWCEVAELIEKAWPRTIWGYKQLDVQLETIGCFDKYITKFQRGKDPLDYMDWENTFVPHE